MNEQNKFFFGSIFLLTSVLILSLTVLALENSENNNIVLEEETINSIPSLDCALSVVIENQCLNSYNDNINHSLECRYKALTLKNCME